MSTPKCEEKVRVFVCACLEGRTGGVTKGWRGMGRSHLGVRKPSGAPIRGVHAGHPSGASKCEEKRTPKCEETETGLRVFSGSAPCPANLSSQGRFPKTREDLFPSKQAQTNTRRPVSVFPHTWTPRKDAPCGRPGCAPRKVAGRPSVSAPCPANLSSHLQFFLPNKRKQTREPFPHTWAYS